MTLVEIVIATALLATFGGAAILATDTASESIRTEVVSAHLESAARHAMAEVTESLLTADASAVNPPPAATADGVASLDYARVVGYDVLMDDLLWSDPERLVFEYDPADPDDGADNDGDGLIDEGRIVYVVNPGVAGERRRVLCNWVAEDLAGEVPGNLVDDNGNGLVDEPGFCLVLEGNRATLRMTLAQLDKRGSRIEMDRYFNRPFG